MTDRFLTVIIRNPTAEDAEELCYHPRVTALSWSHVLNDRDELERRIQRLLNERP